VIAAIYLDAGWPACRAVVRSLFEGRSAATAGTAKDAKTRLQEMLQARALPLPAYELVASYGDEHAKTFDVECRIESLGIRTSGSGTTRRGAEQAAAEQALAALEALEA
jgi:ribonuclease III